jgi:hypothetical protein
LSIHYNGEPPEAEVKAATTAMSSYRGAMTEPEFLRIDGERLYMPFDTVRIKVE